MRFEAALQRALGSAKRGNASTIVVVGGEAELDAEALVERERPLVVWDTRRSSVLSPELVVGSGASVRVRATGPDRFARVRDACRAVFDRLRVVGDASPRFYGGFAFEPGALGPFGSFGDASFVLPRWSAITRGASTRVELVLGAEELERPEKIRSEARERLARRAPRPVATAAPRLAADGAGAFSRAASRALESIASGELEKVVVVREACLAGAFSLSRVLAQLALEPETVRFCFADERAAFVGATPELLVRTDGEHVASEAVAGTVRRRGRDANEIASLVESDKEAREHACVVRAVRAGLERAGAELEPNAERRVRTLGRVHHLVTPVSAHARGVSVLDLAAALHPTPAVCGTPRELAWAWLREHERITRGWFGAPFGFVDGVGAGAFVVTLRSALLDVEGAHVYAGAGMVAGSRVELELDETEAKLASMFAALDVRSGESHVASEVAP